MTDYPLHLREGHLYLEAEGVLWLLDTGAPLSFGRSGPVIAGRRFEVGVTSAGLDASSLSAMVNVECEGLLGADVLAELDWILDLRGGAARASAGELVHAGTSVSLENFMGIPIVEARVGAETCRLFFDTGAQISYLEDDRLASWPRREQITDFYPVIGQFQIDVHEVEIELGAVRRPIRCGALPASLQGLLAMAGVAGIVGHEIVNDRVTGYFPRRGVLVT